MDKLKLGPDTERHSSYSIIRGPETSELFTFTEVKPGLAVIKLEPNGGIDLDPDGVIDPEADNELDPLALNTERDGSVVDQDDLPCPLAFLAVEGKAEDGTWDAAAATVKVELDGETHCEQYGVHLEELNGVGKEAWKAYMRIHTRRRRCKSSKVGQTRKYQQTKTEEELEKERECNRLYMRRLRASQSLEEVERRREKGRMYKRLSVLRRTPEEAARQREQNRLYMQRLRASQAPEEVERRREKGRIYKRLSLLNQTPEKAARQREQNKLYMRRLRASHTPEEVERRKERNRMYKRLSMLRRTPEETAKQKEQNRLYMRQLRANKVNEKTEKSRTQRLSLSHLNSEVEENRFSVGLLETSQTAEIPEQGKCIRTLEHQKQRSGSSDTKMNKAPQQEIVSPVIEMNKLFKMKGTDMDGYHAFNICHLRQTSAMEEVKREFDRQMWQCSGFWDYLALLNKTQPDQSKLHTAALETCEDECRKTERRN